MMTDTTAIVKTNERIMFEFKNTKQNIFHDQVMRSVARQLPFRHFFYGGAIRGGKTFVCLFILVKLAKKYPNSRWHIIRASFPDLEDTTIPSMEKLIGKIGNDFVWKRKSSNYHVSFTNGSKIFFVSENLKQDKTLGSFLGLETNGIMLEQMEGLSLDMYKMAIQRIGSWYIDPMPIPILLGTFNPTPQWPKKIIYDRYIKKELKPQELFVEALPDDNPFVTNEQWSNWSNLDEESYNQMIRAIWLFAGQGNLWAYSFRPDKHIVNVTDKMKSNYLDNIELMKIQKSLPVNLIFDFNVDPITCLVGQRNGLSWAKLINEYRLRNSDIFELTERIRNDYGDYYLVATGDASGHNRTAITRGNRSFVQIIQKELQLSPQQMQFPRSNPSVANTRIVVNSVLAKHKEFWISSACQYLIDDLTTIKTDGTGGILDKKKEEKSLRTHLLDNLRYFLWNYFRKFVNI